MLGIKNMAALYSSCMHPVHICWTDQRNACYFEAATYLLTEE